MKKDNKGFRNIGVVLIVIVIVINLGLIRINGRVSDMTEMLEETMQDYSIAEEFEEEWNAYVIKDNKLYYNIVCNEKQQVVFITDIDEYNENFWVSGYTNKYAEKLPVVMVNGKLCLFLPRNMKKCTEHKNFYLMDQILIDKISIEQEEVFLFNSETLVELGKDLKQNKQYLQTEVNVEKYDILLDIIEKIPNDAKIKSTMDKYTGSYSSYREASEVAKNCILE